MLSSLKQFMTGSSHEESSHDPMKTTNNKDASFSTIKQESDERSTIPKMSGDSSPLRRSKRQRTQDEDGLSASLKDEKIAN